MNILRIPQFGKYPSMFFACLIAVIWSSQKKRGEFIFGYAQDDESIH